MSFHRYALCPAPWGWHMRRVPPLRRPLPLRLLRVAALAAAVAAGYIGLLALGAWLDEAPEAARPAYLAEVQP